MADFASLDRYLENNRQTHLDQLFELLKIPSVSADSSKRAEMDRAAQWVADRCREQASRPN